MRSRPLVLPPLLPVVVCLMAGIIVGDAMDTHASLWLWLMLLTVLAILLFRLPKVQLPIIGSCIVLTGMLLAQRQYHHLSHTSFGTCDTLYAVVLSPPAERPKSVVMDVLTTDGRAQLKCYLYKDEASLQLRPGDGLCIVPRTTTRLDGPHLSPWFRHYLAAHNYTGSCYVGRHGWQHTATSTTAWSALQRLRLRFLMWREHLLDRCYRIDTHGDQDAYGVLAAMTLGDKSALSATVKDVYTRTGASHVLALSGLHLAIIFMLLSGLLPRNRLRMPGLVALLLSVWSFAFLTGLSTSIMRAALMLSLYGLLSLGRRQPFSLGVLSFAAVVMLIANPYTLFDVSFQLSFSAILSIQLFTRVLNDTMPARLLCSSRWTRWLWELVAVSIAVQVGTAPLVAYHFGRLPVYFLLTNLLAVPAVTLLLYGLLPALFFPPMMDVLYRLVQQLNAALAVLSHLPMASIDGLHPTVVQVALVYTALFSLYAAWLKVHRKV